MVKISIILIVINFAVNQILWIKKCVFCGKGFTQKYGFVNGVTIWQFTEQ